MVLMEPMPARESGQNRADSVSYLRPIWRATFSSSKPSVYLSRLIHPTTYGNPSVLIRLAPQTRPFRAGSGALVFNVLFNDIERGSSTGGGQVGR